MAQPGPAREALHAVVVALRALLAIFLGLFAAFLVFTVTGLADLLLAGLFGFIAYKVWPPVTSLP